MGDMTDSTVPLEVDLAEFEAAHAAGAVVLDVRNPDEYLAGHVPGAVLIPLDRAGAPARRRSPTAIPSTSSARSAGRSLTATKALVGRRLPGRLGRRRHQRLDRTRRPGGDRRHAGVTRPRQPATPIPPSPGLLRSARDPGRGRPGRQGRPTHRSGRSGSAGRRATWIGQPLSSDARPVGSQHGQRSPLVVVAGLAGHERRLAPGRRRAGSGRSATGGAGSASSDIRRASPGASDRCTSTSYSPSVRPGPVPQFAVQAFLDPALDRQQPAPHLLLGIVSHRPTRSPQLRAYRRYQFQPVASATTLR